MFDMTEEEEEEMEEIREMGNVIVMKSWGNYLSKGIPAR